MSKEHLVSETTEYIAHALTEFEAMGWLDEDGNYKDVLQELVCKNTLELLTLLGIHGYSGMSVDYTIDLFNKLAQFKPLGPLTGEVHEWALALPNNPTYFQNIRCSHVFKKDGIAYNNKARVFQYGKDGPCFSSIPYGHEVILQFPYHVPQVKIITLPTEYKESGINTIPDSYWKKVGINYATHQD